MGGMRNSWMRNDTGGRVEPWSAASGLIFTDPKMYTFVTFVVQTPNTSKKSSHFVVGNWSEFTVLPRNCSPQSRSSPFICLQRLSSELTREA